jgi:cold shock CspA family protein
MARPAVVPTITAWYSEHKLAIPNLTVASAPEVSFWEAVKTNDDKPTGFSFIDAAGSVTDVMVHAATIADLTTTAAKPGQSLETISRRPAEHVLQVTRVPACLFPPHLEAGGWL